MLSGVIKETGQTISLSSPGSFRHGAGYVIFRASAKMVEWLWQRPRNWIYGSTLGAENFNVGARARFKGLRCIHVGANFKALDRVWLETIENGTRYQPQLIIGATVSCSDSVHIAATHRVSIGNDVLIGSRVTITDHNHGVYQGMEQSSPEQRPWERVLTSDGVTIVEDNVWLGDGVVVLPGGCVGRGSIVGANSVVLGRIPPYSIAVGSPARVIRTFDFEQQAWIAADAPEISRTHPC